MISFLGKFKLLHVVLAGVLLLIFLGNSAPIDDPDVWWHLKAGQEICDNLSIPKQDIYSFSNSGHRWIAHEWLAEAIFYKVYDWLGYQGLLLFNVSVIFLAYYLLYKVISERCKKHTAIVAVLMISAAVLNTIFWMFRPHIIAYLLFILFIYILYNFRERPQGIYFLPFLTVFWVNIHGSFIIGIWLVFAYLASGLFRYKIGRLKGREHTARQNKKLTAVFVLCFMAVLINPNTYDMFLYPFQTVNSSMITSNVLEWLSPDFHQFRMQLFLVYMLAVFAAAALSRGKIYYDDLANLLAFAALSLYGARNFALFVFVSLPIAAEYLAGLFKKRDKDFQLPMINFALIMAVVAIILISWPRVGTIDEYTGKNEFPVKAVRFMRENNLKGNIFNEYDWGGYLIWTRYPENKVFIDGRADMYADRVIPDYVKITSAKMDSMKAFSQYDVKYVLLRTGQPFMWLLNSKPEWKVIYRDEIAVLYSLKQQGTVK
jgi:hypothetical protein